MTSVIERSNTKGKGGTMTNSILLHLLYSDFLASRDTGASSEHLPLG